ncbi:uncharacterized protein LOC121640177 [Melanotaenia boesemani]|uniref:uncharacterized protein LOC121640177 n=1 Tax=Melanotaenia boesemani TaxID=1250792 RepID=UPI001C0448AB|nr:uncharacterized protein LOC121640177 [Melanotaenia boesemani]
MMKWFLFLAAFLPITPTMTEVVASVSDCSEFLLGGRPPKIPGIIENGAIQNQNRYKPICQTFNNKRRFLTVYDTTNKIPVFSAYKFKKVTAEERPNIPWMVEPQLSGDTDKNMKNYTPKKYDKQAIDGVPQVKNFNRGRWRVVEDRVKSLMEKVCINNGVIEGFVVVGAHPSTNKVLNNRVNIPKMLWSAFYCYNSTENKWLASAYWGNNTDEKEPLSIKTVDQLNTELNKELKTTSVNVFPG